MNPRPEGREVQVDELEDRELVVGEVPVVGSLEEPEACVFDIRWDVHMGLATRVLMLLPCRGTRCSLFGCLAHPIDLRSI